MPKKRKKIIIISIVVLLILLLIAGGVCIYLYLTTDAFKSNRTLFEKYLAQNFDVIQNSMENKSNDINNLLDNSKYTSNLTGNVNYISADSQENSQETSNNLINNVELNVNSQVDKTNQYDYKDIRLSYETENVARVEYIRDKSLLGARLNGIKQFVTIDNQNLKSASDTMSISIDTLDKICLLLTNELDISELINFTDEEKEILADKYIDIINKETNQEAFNKINKQIIEVNGTQVIANGYYIETTKERFNNILIKLLEQLANDEIILSKIDNIGNKLEEYNLIENTQDLDLRQQFTEYVNNYITEIKNTNIGNETHRITVYENNGQIVKTLIESQENTTNIDIYNNGTSVILQNSKIENKNQTKNLIKIENNSQSTLQNIIVQYENIKNDVVINNIQFKTSKELKNDQIEGNTILTYEINGNKIELSTTEYIQQVNEFKDKMELNEDNNISLNVLGEEQINILIDNINNQINNVADKIGPDELNEMLKELGFIKEDIFKEEEPIQVTEVERNRFNSQLVFFIGEKQNSNNINLLLNAIAQSLEDATIENTTTDRGEEKLNQIVLNVQRNTQNDEKLQEIRDVLAKNEKEEFDVEMSYDEETLLINRIYIKVHQDD